MVIISGSIVEKMLFVARRKFNYNLKDPTQFFDNWLLSKNGFDYEVDVKNNEYIANDEIFNYFYNFLTKNQIKEKNILDVGSGSGLTGEKFINLSYNLYGADIIKESKFLALNRGYKEIYYLNLKTGMGRDKIDKFNLIISSGVLGDFVHPKLGLENLFYLLNSGGYAFFSIEEDLFKSNYSYVNYFKKKGLINIIDHYKKKAYNWESIQINYNYFLIERK